MDTLLFVSCFPNFFTCCRFASSWKVLDAVCFLWGKGRERRKNPKQHTTSAGVQPAPGRRRVEGVVELAPPGPCRGVGCQTAVVVQTSLAHTS